MNIGIPKEIKAFEHRILLTPEAVQSLTANGDNVYFEGGAGNESGFSDKDYESAGAQIMPTSEKVFEKVDLVLKIHPPMPIEYELIKEDHIIFSLLFPQNSSDKLKALLSSHAIFLSAELIDPIKNALSELTGKVAINQALKYLEKDFGGKGILFSGACGISGANVTILGCGPLGNAVAHQALLFGAKVNYISENYQQLLEFKSNHPFESLEVFEYDRGLLANLLLETDVLIAASQIPGQKSKLQIKKNDLKLLSPGSLIIDLSVFNGDCIETSRETKQDDPIYINDGLLFYAVQNLPSAVPRTSSQVLSNISIQYVCQLARMGFQEAMATSPDLRNSLIIYRGKIVNQILINNDEFEHYDILELLELNI
jgi:alanine dehydrogenase